MENSTWKLIESIYDAAIELAEVEQINFITKQSDGNKDIITQVTKMLEANKDDGFMGYYPGKINPENIELSNLSHIGHFKIIKKIATGGMGRVYLAQSVNSDVAIQVAVKTIRVELINANLKAKFQNEKQILSKLKHKNIASLIDAGISDKNIPYIATEWVEGENIKIYCIKNNLPIKHRLNLFLQVCNAMTFAHNKLIIHRDLKPENILVNNHNEVKLLDFGIAKIIDHEQSSKTQTQIFTLDYAAPEQLNGDMCTAATDIYSLGIILFEILTNSKRFNTSHLPVTEQIKSLVNPKALNLNSLQVEETLPYSISRLKGSLINIINKAMHIDPNRRYDSVASFIVDVNNYLENRPIKAMKDNFYYRFKMFVIRNKFSSAILTLCLAVISSAVYVSVKQIEQKLIEAQKSKQVTEFLVDSIQASDPDLTKGENVSVVEFLINAKARMKYTSFEDQKLSSMLSQTIGKALIKVGEFNEAEVMLLQALSTNENNFDTRLSLTNLYLNQQAYDKATQQLSVLKFNNTSLNQSEKIQLLQIEARIMSKNGQLTESINYIKEAIDYQIKINDKSESLIKSQLILASILDLNGEFEASKIIIRKALKLSQSSFGSESTITTEIYNQLARTLSNGSPVPWDEVFENYQLAYENQIKIYGNNHPIIAKTLLDQGFALRFVGKLDEAKNNAQKAMKIALINFDDSHILVAHINLLISQIYFAQSEVEKAIKTLQSVVEIYHNYYGENHFETNQLKTSLALYFIKNTNYKKALALLNPLYISQKKQLGEFNKATFYVQLNLMKARLKLKDFTGLVEETEVLFKNSKIHLGDQNILTIGIEILLAQIYQETNNNSQALLLCNELLSFGMIKNNKNYLNKITAIRNNILIN